MEDGYLIKIGENLFKYDSFYKRLERVSEDGLDIDDAPAIACPKCLSTEFTISYASYECIANCHCGNSFTIYDG